MILTIRRRAASLGPIITSRRRILVADATDLLVAGFPLLATLDHPHWTVILARSGADLVVETWISHGPRAADSGFDPRVGDAVTVGDDEEPPLVARVVERDGNRVWVCVELPRALADSA